ncbi:MAG: N-acetyl-gamma-glutamyl-phosphate reductase [Spirochaetaceae bacterium]|jgi:N-acetyl-gamma-glutamyl-phosphate reductase|nr:N-acetyl-gamma-glutamyl-phosphate reductase [Spirochaetaceae bacterium]
MIAGVIGAAGYAGAEIVRILSRHPKIDALAASSTSYEGKKISDIYPNFTNLVDITLENPEAVIARSGVVFAALPHGVGETFAAKCFERGIPYIDMSADFRFDDDEEIYAAWYGKTYMYPELHKISIYGLPELNRGKLQKLAKSGGVIVGNPGCYPTAASLAAFPALARGLYGGGTIIIDAASGITGGGREPGRAYHFPECSDSMTPYKVCSHRHTPEISRNFSFMENMEKINSGARPLIFTPRLAPMNRGILSTLYIPLSDEWKCKPAPSAKPRPPSSAIQEKTERVRQLYAEFYQHEKFIRVLPKDVLPATGRVRLSNFCDIAVQIDQNGANLVVISAIDNMVKGAAGQAVQNMNIIFGFDEGCGLDTIPSLF